MKKTVFLIVISTFIAICSAQTARPIVKDVQASLSETERMVELTWSISQDASDSILELLVYKNIDTIIRPSTLSILTPIATVTSNTTQYFDTINDYNTYYYAVVAKTHDGTLYDVIIPSVNATDKAIVRTKAQTQNLATKENSETPAIDVNPRIDATVQAPLREKPLPYIEILDNTEVEPVIALENTTRNVIATAPTSDKRQEYFEPYILDKDSNAENAIGDDYTLYTIVSSYVAPEDWANAEQELLKFLQINRTADATARANFYLAQVYYFQQNYRTAVTHFQRAERLYPFYAKKWIEETLDKLTIS